MKRLLILFGVLDLITVVKVAFHSNFFNTYIFLFYLSLLISGFYLIRKKEIGLWINYAQFPFRLLFASFSLGFLMPLNSYFDDPYTGSKIIIVTLSILEIGRLILSILIHRKYFRPILKDLKI